MRLKHPSLPITEDTLSASVASLAKGVLHLSQSLFSCDMALSDPRWAGRSRYLSDGAPGVHHDGDKERWCPQA